MCKYKQQSYTFVSKCIYTPYNIHVRLRNAYLSRAQQLCINMINKICVVE